MTRIECLRWDLKMCSESQRLYATSVSSVFTQPVSSLDGTFSCFPKALCPHVTPPLSRSGGHLQTGSAIMERRD